MKGLTVLLPHQFKLFGKIVAVTGLLLSITTKFIRPNSLFERVVPDAHALFLSILGLGLYFIAMSKEKFEDERTKQIRSRALQSGFVGVVVLLLLLSFAASFVPDQVQITPATDLATFSIIGLGIYLLLFQIGIQADEVWNYNEEKGRLLTFKNNKKSLLYISLATSVFIVVIYFI